MIERPEHHHATPRQVRDRVWRTSRRTGREDGLIGAMTVAENFILDTYDREPLRPSGHLNCPRSRENAEGASRGVRRPHALGRHLRGLPVGRQPAEGRRLAREFSAASSSWSPPSRPAAWTSGRSSTSTSGSWSSATAATAVLIVSPELDEVFALGDRIAVMYEGKITGFRDPDVPAADLAGLMAGGADTAPAAGTAPGEDDADASPITGIGTPRTGPPAGSGGLVSTAPPSPPTAAEEGSPESQRRTFGQVFKESFLEGNTVTVTVLALVSATVLGGLLAAFTNPAVLHAPAGDVIPKAWDVASSTYVALFEGSVFDPHTVAALFQQSSISTAIHDGYLSAVFGPLSETAVGATPLILTGLAVALPYQAGLFNIGGQSQFIGGAIMAAWLGYDLSLPFFVHVVVCVLGSFVGGAAIGWITGELKARTGAHEVIVTIMLNYVMAYFLAYLLSSPSLLRAPGSANSITPPIASNAHLPLLAGSDLRINAGFLIALACAFGAWWLLNRTTTGFEFRSVGANPSAARVAGMKVERSWVLVFVIGGGLAGLAASTVIQGTDFTLNPQSFGTYGIDAITVALLGRGKPGGVVAAGLCSARCTRDRPACRTRRTHRCRSSRCSRR